MTMRPRLRRTSPASWAWFRIRFTVWRVVPAIEAMSSWVSGIEWEA